MSEHNYVCTGCGATPSAPDRDCPGVRGDECSTCEEYRREYNVAIANGLVMKAQSVTARWGGHNRSAHRD